MLHQTQNNTCQDNERLDVSSSVAASVSHVVSTSPIGIELAEKVAAIRRGIVPDSKIGMLRKEGEECRRHLEAASLGEKLLNGVGYESKRQSALAARIVELDKQRQDAGVSNEEKQKLIAAHIASAYEKLFQPNAALSSFSDAVVSHLTMMSDRKEEWRKVLKETVRSQNEFLTEYVNREGAGVLESTVPYPLRDEIKRERLKIIQKGEVADVRSMIDEGEAVLESQADLKQMINAAMLSADGQTAVPIFDCAQFVEEKIAKLATSIREFRDAQRADDASERSAVDILDLIRRCVSAVSDYETVAAIALYEVCEAVDDIQGYIALAIMPEAEAEGVLPILKSQAAKAPAAALAAEALSEAWLEEQLAWRSRWVN